MTTPIGLRGVPCGAVDTFGIARLDERGATIPWWVAASDTWHNPRRAPSLRQRRIDGVPVVETKLAVPGGDVVHRAFVVADQGGALVYEFENRSPSAVVVAVPSRDASSSAASAGTRPQGAEFGDEVRAFPLAHASSVRFAWPLERPRWGRRRSLDVAALATAEAVVRGWVQACDQASRVTSAVDELRAARSALLLADARDVDDLLRTFADLGVLAVGERVRMGDPVDSWVEGIADAARRVARATTTPSRASRALSISSQLLTLAGESEGAGDVVTAWQRRLDRAVLADSTGRTATEEAAVDSMPVGSLARAIVDVTKVEDRLARPVSPLETRLFVDGLRGARGTNFEAHGLHAGPRHRLSFALRWHGENAALLWELDGPPGLRLAAPDVDARFSAIGQHGEALLRFAQ